MNSVVDRVRPFLWPALVIAGVVIVGCSQATWGFSDEGIGLRITGLGGVDATAADSADAQAFFADQTHRPGLITLILGVVIFLAATLCWWKPFRANRIAVAVAAGIIVAAGVATAVWAGVVVADPARKLFDANVIDAVDLPGPILSPGWGLITTLVVGVITAIGAVIAALLRWRQGVSPAQ
ncbi:hypothetical protein ABLE92_10565 [Gordonia sp. VNQ95]|uniref:hypothetical protein n=1 Tax=Gordonia sp. VNQ95 TaxID=3156619 RepID=UPI0032B329E0